MPKNTQNLNIQGSSHTHIGDISLNDNISEKQKSYTEDRKPNFNSKIEQGLSEELDHLLKHADELLSKGCLSDSIDYLLANTHFFSMKKKRELILLKSRWNRTELQYYNGSLSEVNQLREADKIRIAYKMLLDQLSS